MQIVKPFLLFLLIVSLAFFIRLLVCQSICYSPTDAMQTAKRELRGVSFYQKLIYFTHRRVTSHTTDDLFRITAEDMAQDNFFRNIFKHCRSFNTQILIICTV